MSCCTKSREKGRRRCPVRHEQSPVSSLFSLSLSVHRHPPWSPWRFSRVDAQLPAWPSSKSSCQRRDVALTFKYPTPANISLFFFFPPPPPSSSSPAEFTAIIPPRCNSSRNHARHPLAHPPDLLAPAQAAGVTLAPPFFPSVEHSAAVSPSPWSALCGTPPP